MSQTYQTPDSKHNPDTKSFNTDAFFKLHLPDLGVKRCNKGYPEKRLELFLKTGREPPLLCNTRMEWNIPQLISNPKKVN